MLAFRDPFGIRPLVLGSQIDESGKKSYAVASESVAFNALAYDLERDIHPGEAVFIGFDGTIISRQCSDKAKLSPCLFEYVYFARPDSVIDGVSVYQSRMDMGVSLAEKIKTRAACRRYRCCYAYSRYQPTQRDGACRPSRKTLPRRSD